MWIQFKRMQLFAKRCKQSATAAKVKAGPKAPAHKPAPWIKDANMAITFEEEAGQPPLAFRATNIAEYRRADTSERQSFQSY